MYGVTYEHARAKNDAFHAAFPTDRERLHDIAARLRDHDVVLPDGSPLTVRRLQTLGMALGANSGVPPLHYLLEEAFVDGPDGAELSDTFLHDLQAQIGFAGHPLYAVLHEACYAQGAATRWAAHRLRPAEFDPDATPLLLTGEMIYPWMFADDPALVPFAEAANLLAERDDWPAFTTAKRCRPTRSRWRPRSTPGTCTSTRRCRARPPLRSAACGCGRPTRTSTTACARAATCSTG